MSVGLIETPYIWDQRDLGPIRNDQHDVVASFSRGWILAEPRLERVDSEVHEDENTLQRCRAEGLIATIAVCFTIRRVAAHADSHDDGRPGYDRLVPQG